ncbi:sensor histidine kinase [Sphaerisporangium fuscum]|uniref:sensor histidine kinase n=1 Tax=Sphaerisporangium fuscum TaxID=2835868 RepID=UPI001BDC4EA9|nr:histidine kinase [Sphaerisporangium fuscum]
MTAGGGRTPTGVAITARLLVLAVFVAAQFQGAEHLPLTCHGLLVAALSLTIAAMLATAPLPRATANPPLVVLGIPVRLGLAAVASLTLLALSPGSGPATASLLFAVGASALRYPLPRALPVTVITFAGLLVVGLAGGHWDQELGLGVSTGVVLLFGYSIRQRRAVRSAEAREEVLAERARIAREIHDILAHSLSAQIVHLEGARLLLRADRPDEALDRVERARDLAKTGLEEARRAVAALREDSPPLPVALKALADDFLAATGLACALTVTGAPRRLSPEVELAVIRTAQEALTNVRRHAPGAAAAVRLGFTGDACELEVTNPPGDGQGTAGGGYGLVGMRERAELLGGSLSAEPVDGGFRVGLRLPAAGRGEG